MVVQPLHSPFKVTYSNTYQQKKESLFYHYKIHKFSAIVSSLNCNNFGSNKGIVIKLIVMWSVTYYLSFKPISCGNFVEVPTAGLPTIFSVTTMGCGGAGLSRDHLYTVGPGPKLHLVAVTKSFILIKTDELFPSLVWVCPNHRSSHGFIYW